MNQLTEIKSKQELLIEKRVKSLDKAGITSDVRHAKLKEGLEAGREIDELVDGEIVKRIIPDFPTRHKYLETSYKLSNELSPAEIKTEVNIDNRRTNVNISVEDGKRLLALALELKRLNDELLNGDVQDGEIVSTVNGGDTV